MPDTLITVGDHAVRIHAEPADGAGVALLLHDGDPGRCGDQLAALGVGVVEVVPPAHFWATPAGELWVAEVLNPWARDRWAVPHVALVGTGFGGHAALRLAFRQAGRFPVVATDSAAIDLHDEYGTGTPLDDYYDSREACRQDSALLAVRQFKTPPHIAFACRPTHKHYRGNDRLHEKLNALGVQHTLLTTEQAAEPLATFVAAALRQQARRLL